MTPPLRRLLASSLSALLTAALLAGCGSSGSSARTSSGSSSAPPATSGVPLVASAVAACKHGVQSAPTLSSSTKSKLEGICDKAGSGDESAARQAAKEVCREIVNASPLPSGSIKERALSACNSEAGK